MSYENIKPGDYKLSKFEISRKGVSLGLELIFQELIIYEDIFSPFLSAEILVKDTFNVPTKLPIVGEEDIDIELTTPQSDTELELKFKVISISKRLFPRDTEQNYILQCVPPELIQNLNSRVSKSFSGKTPSQIADTIYFESIVNPLGDANNFFPITTEPCKFTLDCVIPNWRPVEAIEWLAKRAVGNNNQSNYLFYSTLEGFHFRSIEDLIKADVEHDELIVEPAGIDLKEQSAKSNRISNFEIVENFNQLDNISRGMHGSTLNIYDMQTKTFIENKFNYVDSFNGSDHLGLHRMSSEDTYKDYDTTYFMVTTHQKSFQKSVRDDSDVRQWLQMRRSQLQQLNNFKLNVTISGQTDIRAGHVVNFNIPSAEFRETAQGQHKELIDRHYSGKFLVTAIKHVINQERYDMILELTKDSFNEQAKLSDE